MADFEITSPEGKKFRVTAPEGATQEQVMEYAKQNFDKAGASAEPSFTDSLKRSAGLVARTAGPTLAGGAVGAAAGSVIPGVGTVLGGAAGMGAMTIAQLIDNLRGSDTTGLLMDKLGIPRPETGPERFATTVGGALTGTGVGQQVGGLLAKSAGPVVSRIGQVLRADPVMQGAGAVTGGTATHIAQEAGAGPVGQTIAGLAGGMVPSIPAGAAAVARGVFRGGEKGRQTTAENIKLFEDSGYGTPSVGQATESRVGRGIESTLAKTPGSAGRMADTAERGAANLGASVEATADTLSPGATSTRAGATIEKGIKGFIDRFKSEQGFLYDKIDPHIAPGKAVDVTNTKAALQSLNADIPGAPALSQWFKNAKIQGIAGALDADTLANTLSQNKLPYEALKKLRTLVGNELENVSLTSDVPRSKWKALYGALSEDMRAAAQAAGPDAVKAFERANTFTSAGHTRIETFLERVVGKDTVEKVFQAAVAPSELREGASTINAVMRSLAPSERQVVQAAFLKRLGTATAGQQDAAGEVFSPATFLTNWNKMSPEAKLTLFAGGNGKLRADLDKIAQVAENLKAGSKVFANPSGTGQAATAGALGGGAVVALLTGDLSAMGAVTGTVIGANIVSRLMTSPTVVHWLAQNTKTPTHAIPVALQQLATSARNLPDAAEQAAINELIQKVSKSTGQPK